MASLFIAPEEARLLDCMWVRLWLLFGGEIQVQPMPPEHPAMFVEKKAWPSHS